MMALKAKENHSPWQPTLNHAINERDHRDCDGGVVQYSSMNELLMEYIEKKGNVAYNKGHAALDVCLRRIVVALEHEEEYPGPLCPSMVVIIY